MIMHQVSRISNDIIPSVALPQHLQHLQPIPTTHYFYNMNDKIGQGSYGKVYRGINASDSSPIAIKVIKKYHDYTSLLALSFKREIKSLQSIQGSHVIKYIDSYQDQNYIYIITELCSKTLHHHIQPIPKQQFYTYYPTNQQILQTIRIFKQIATGVYQIHQQSYLHRDLKPSNLLLDANNNIKICDFGLSIKQNELTQIQSYKVGSCAYIAPEIIHFNNYSYKSDIWALGVIFYEILYGQLPFSETVWQIEDFYSEKENLNHKLSDNHSFNQHPLIKKLNAIIKKCLNINPAKRYNSQQLISALTLSTQQVSPPIKKNQQELTFLYLIIDNVLSSLSKCSKMSFTTTLKQTLEHLKKQEQQQQLAQCTIKLKSILKLPLSKLLDIMKRIRSPKQMEMYEGEIKLTYNLMILQSFTNNHQSLQQKQYEFNLKRNLKEIIYLILNN